MYIDHFDALKTLIETHLTTVKKVDWYNRQYERYQDLKAEPLPAVYIEFPRPVNWKTAGNKLQLADVVIRLHVVMFSLEDKPVQSLSLAKQVDALLNAKPLRQNNLYLSTALVRNESDLITEYDQLKVMVLGYATTLHDASLVPQLVPTNPQFVVKERT